MRNKWTRVGKALLCLTLAASMLAGCGGGGGSSSSSGAAGKLWKRRGLHLQRGVHSGRKLQ